MAELVVGAIVGEAVAALFKAVGKFAISVRKFAKEYTKHEETCEAIQTEIGFIQAMEKHFGKELPKLSSADEALMRRFAKTIEKHCRDALSLSAKLRNIDAPLQSCGIVIGFFKRRVGSEKWVDGQLKSLQQSVERLKQDLDMGLNWQNNVLLRSIVDTSNDISRGHSADVTLEKNLYGTDEGILFLGETLRSAKAEIVCLHGMGGVGKTTLAALAYNNESIKRKFQKRVWVRCEQQSLSGSEVMKALLEEWWLLSYSEKVFIENERNTEKVLHDCLKQEIVLVVIDDIWKVEQIDWIDRVIPENCSVIITTRNKCVVTTHRVTCHHVKPLGPEDSLKLLCQSAFEKEHPPSPRLIDVAKRVCEHCHGLPLALSVVGKSLFQNDQLDSWQSWLNKAKGPGAVRLGFEPDYYQNVVNILAKSINALRENEPVLLDMFLDLVGFPKRISRDQVVTMWSIYPEAGDLQTAKVCLNRLVRLSLVEPEGDEHVSVHDLMREAAIYTIKSIEEPRVTLGSTRAAHGATAKESGRHERLFFMGDETDALHTESLESVKKFSVVDPAGLFKCGPNRLPEVYLTEDWTMPSLVSFCCFMPATRKNDHEDHLFFSPPLCRHVLERIARSGSLQIMALFNLCPSTFDLHYDFSSLTELRVLYAHFQAGDPGKMFPSSILKLCKLQVLDIWCCDVKGQMTVDLAAIEELTELNVLRMSGVTLVSLGDERRDVEGGSERYRSSQLTQHAADVADDARNEAVVISVEKLLRPKLKELSIHKCFDLQDTFLPSKIGQLTSLRSIVISHWFRLTKLCSQIGDLIELAQLKLVESVISELPSSIGRLRNLGKIDFERCPKLAGLPPEIGDLMQLQELNLTWCNSIKELPASIGNLLGLEKLRIEHCEGLKSLPDEIGGLEGLNELDLKWCRNLERLPTSLGKSLKNLEILRIGGCFMLRSLPTEIGDLPRLKELTCSQSGLEELPLSIGNLHELEKIHIEICSQLTRLPDEIGNLPQLKELKLMWCSRIETLPTSVGRLRRLEILHIEGCSGLTSLPEEIGALPQLREVKFSECGLTELPASMAKFR